MTSYTIHNDGKELGTLHVQHNTVIEATGPFAVLVNRDWEQARAMFDSMGLEIRPVVDDDDDEPVRPQEYHYKGNTYRFEWAGDSLVRILSLDAHEYPVEITWDELPLAVRRAL